MSAGILFNNTTAVTSTAAGNSGDVLTSQGAGSPPIFTAPATYPRVFAYRSSDQLNVTGNGTQFPVVFNATTVNTGTAFNTTTGKYTVPESTDYQMSGAVLVRGLTSAMTYGLIYIYDTTAAAYILLGGEKHAYNNADVNGATQFQFCSIATLIAAHVIELRILVQGGALVADVQGQGVPYCTYWSIAKI